MPSWQEKESVRSWRKLRDLMRCLAKGLAIMPENRYNKNDSVREHCEELVMNHAQYDQETGKPLDQSYLECGLPDDLQASIQEMQKSLLGRVLEHQRKMLEYQLGHIESLSSLIQDLDEDIKKNRIYKLGN